MGTDLHGAASQAVVAQWDIIELTFAGPSAGNPFTEVDLTARFTQNERKVTVAGFYDGAGVFKIRFMPEAPGEWRYTTTSNCPGLNNQAGSFDVTPPAPGNHGPVRIWNTYHFAYADGTPFRQIGTTCYAWVHQGDALEEQTLETLARAPFNKLRMCVFPKHYLWNNNEPVHYPFEGTPPAKWDFARFNPEFFRHLEMRIGRLRDLGIEADIILFHPYDGGHWGFDRMPHEADERYVRYVVARFSAYRNVWWSMANEFDLMRKKAPADWDRLFQIVQASDPYGHLRSIHNARLVYNHAEPWVTHVSFQSGAAVQDYVRAMIYRSIYRKPVVFDEVKYEGNVPQPWGQLSAEEMVFRFWEGTVAGTYVGHGETYRDPNDIIWWSKGGTLHGQSPARLAFLRKIMDDGPRDGLEPIDKWEDWPAEQDWPYAGKAGQYYLVYFGHATPTEWAFKLPMNGVNADTRYTVEVIDTWNMTITPVAGLFETKKGTGLSFADKGGRSVVLPGRAYMALRIRRVD